MLQTVVTFKLPVTDYQRVVALAVEEGLTTRKGQPNLSKAFRHVVAAGLAACAGSGPASRRGQEAEAQSESRC